MISKLFKWAAAITCALPLVAGAETVGDWFFGGVEDSQVTTTNATWETSSGAVVPTLDDNGMIVVDNDGTDTLDLVPTADAPDTNVLTRVTIKSSFPPNGVDDLANDVDDAKTALALAINSNGETNYYAYTGTVNGWIPLSGATLPASDEEIVTAIVELNAYESSVKARFKIGDAWLKNANDNDNQWIALSTTQANVTKVSFAGSCLIESVDTKMQLGVAKVDNIKYPTYVDAIKASKTVIDPTITVLRESDGEIIGAGNLANYSTVNGVLTAIVDWSPWAYSSGIVVWRADSGQVFHASTVADVGEYGQIGDEYTFGSAGHPWQVFASNQSQYRSPGAVLVFDEAGYNNNSDAQFAPMSFGGMWVRALQAENTPYCITDNKTDGSNRQVELGAANASTYFKFDESFTFNRNTATAVKGTATVEIADGKTFTINARANKGAVVEAGNTLVLKGAGTLAVVSGLSVYGTLDLSEVTRPTISGDVALAGTIVLPAETEVSPESPFTVCSGTLSGANVYVKIGDSEAVEKSFTAENGAITSFGEPQYIFYDNYPTVVPAGKTYTFVGGETAESAVTVPSTVSVSGTLKTSGFITVPYYAASTGATLDVIDGTTTLNCGSQAIKGVVTVRENATLVNGTTDAITYGTDRTEVNVYGTVSMGNTRWSLKNTAINMYGGTITGDGQGTNGALDFLLEDGYTGELNAYATSTISASIKFRNTLVPVTVEENATLTLSGVIRTQTSAAGVTKKGVGNLTFTSSPTLPAGIVHENGHLVFSTEDDVNLTTTYTSKPSDTTSLWYARQSNWKGTVVLPVLSAPTALPLDTYGNANSKIVLKGTSGSCYLSAGTIASELVIDTEGDDKVEFNNGSSGQIVNFTKVSGSGTLNLVGWAGCSSATYNLTTTSNFTGLAVHNAITRGGGGTFTIGIGDIVTTGSTAPGACVLPIAQTAVDDATGTVVYNLDNATLNGVAANLEVKEDGIYVKNLVAITVPAVANTTVTVEVGGETIGTAAGNYDVEPGSVVKVTYAAADGYQISGTTVYEIDTNSETTFTPSETQVAQIVAYIGETPYTSLASAFSAVDEGDTLTLVGSAVTLAEDVTVTNSYTLAGDAEGTTVTGSGKIYLTGSAELTLDATLTSVGNQFWFSSKDAKLTFPTAGTAPIVRPYTGYQTGTTVNGDGTSTYYQYLFLQLLVGSSNVSLAYENGDPLVQKQVYEGDEIVFTATPAEGYENPVVTVNGEPLAPVDGKYTVVVGTVNVAIQATATAIPPVAQVVHGQTVTPYLTLAEAVAAAEAGDTVRLLANCTGNAVVAAGVAITLDLNGCTFSSESGDAIANYGTLTIGGASGSITAAGAVVRNRGNNSSVTINSGTYTSTGDNAFICGLAKKDDPVSHATATGCSITINGGTITSREMAAATGRTSGTVITVNGGTLTSTDNAVVADNGTAGCSGNVITVKNATLNGGIVSDGYVACGIYLANADTLTVTNTIINVAGGCGILARAGVANVLADTVITTTGSVTGKVGDSRVVVPCSALVYDKEANYPGYADGSKVAVSGGTFTSAAAAVYQVPSDSETKYISITGGSYSSDPSAFVASGYAAKEGSGYWVVSAKSGIDPAAGVTETTVEYENTGSLSDDELTAAVVAAAVTAGKITPPTEAVTPEAYAAYFTYTVTGDSGNYTLAIAGLQPTVLEDVDASVAAQLVSTTTGSNMTVTVKPGLYYGFTTGTTLTLAEPELQLSTGETVTVTKPGTTQGFVKIKVSATNN